MGMRSDEVRQALSQDAKNMRERIADLETENAEQRHEFLLIVKKQEQRIATLEAASNTPRGRTEYSMRMESMVDELQGRVKELEAERDKWQSRADHWLSRCEELLPAVNKAEVERDGLREAFYSIGAAIANERCDSCQPDTDKPGYRCDRCLRERLFAKFLKLKRTALATKSEQEPSDGQ